MLSVLTQPSRQTEFMFNDAPSAIRAGDPGRLSGFGQIVYVQNWENARHLRNVRVLSANTFAVVIAACLAALQFVRSDPVVELTLLGFLVVVALIQLMISIELKRELDDCMARIARQVEATPWRDDVGLLPSAQAGPGWLRLRWLYSAFYLATAAALLIMFAHRVWA